MTTHKPATALPLLIIQRAPYPNLRSLADGERVSQVVLARDYESEHAGEYVRRANAYPRLVARVNHIAHWQPSVDDERLATSAIDREIYEARALLRDLGEL